MGVNRSLGVPAAVWVLGLLALLVSGCGGGDDDTTSASPTPGRGGAAGGSTPGGGNGGGGGAETGTEEALAAAAKAAFEAFLAGDDQAYFQAIVRSCREEIGFAPISERNRSRRAIFTRTTDVSLRDVQVTDVLVTDFDGSTANVALAIEFPGEGQFGESLPHAWAMNEGAWRLADCSDFSPGNEFSSSSQDDPLEYGMIGEVARWLVYVAYAEENNEWIVDEPGVDEPPAGTQYYSITLNAYYDGPEESVVFSDVLEVTLVAGGRVYGEESSCGETTSDIAIDAVYRPGEEAEGIVCRAVRSDDVADVLVHVRAKDGSEDAWFEPK